MAKWLRHRTPEREVGGSILTRVDVNIVFLGKTHLLSKSTGNTPVLT